MLTHSEDKARFSRHLSPQWGAKGQAGLFPLTLAVLPRLTSHQRSTPGGAVICLAWGFTGDLQWFMRTPKQD
jgi:hypothetical protein